MFYADVYRDPDETKSPTRYHSLRWPDAIARLPVVPPATVPFIWQTDFAIEDDHPPPAYAKVASEQVPLEGTDELRSTVKKFHDALSGRDASAMADLVWFRAQDNHRYYSSFLPPPSKGTIAHGYGQSFNDPWAVPEWNPDRLVFTKRAEGRLVHVTGVDGHALTGTKLAGPKATFRLNPLLVRHQDGWQLYR
jgi:hypothetical protein